MANPSRSNNLQNNAPKLNISEDTIRELLAVQKLELEARMEETKRSSIELNANQSLAKQSIEAQERDRKHEREEQTKRQQNVHRFSLIALGLMLAFSGGALYIGQGALVLDIIKIAAGFAAGMGVQAYRSRKLAASSIDIAE